MVGGLRRVDVIGDEFDRFAREIRAVAEKAGRALQPLVEQQQRMAEQLRPVFDTGPLVAALRTRMAPFQDEIRRAFDALPERNRTALRVLATSGWYLEREMSYLTLFETADLFDAGETERAHQKLCDYFEDRLADIEGDICSRFAKRARVLTSAFEAHRREDYALSIPVFLAQADGICKELVGVQLYARRNGIPQLAASLEVEDSTPFRESLLCPLVEPNPISAGEKERAGLPDPLNRHAILHGDSFDYDTS